MNASLYLVLTTSLCWFPPSNLPDTTGSKPIVTSPTGEPGGSPDPVARIRPVPAEGESPTEAERITGKQRNLDADQKSLEVLKGQLESPGSEFHQAEAAFLQLILQMEERREYQEKLRQDGNEREVVLLEEELTALEEQRQLARDRFDLAIQERKLLQQKVLAMEQKIHQDRLELDELLGSRTKPASPEAVPVPRSDSAASDRKEGSGSPAANVASAMAKTDLRTSSTPPVAPPRPVESAGDAAATRTSNRELSHAQEIARAKQAACEAAREKVQSISDRLEIVEKNLAVEQQLLEASRRKADQAEKLLASLNEEVQKKLAEDPSGVDPVMSRVSETQRRLREARAAIRESTDRLQLLQNEVNARQTEQIQALQDAQRKQREAKKAEEKVAELKYPFTPQNLLQWLLDHGPKLGIIVLGMVFLYLLGKLFSRRIVKLMARSGARGTEEERENRASTLVGVFRNFASLAILGGGSLMLLDAVGIPIVPLMGGAAVVGLAVAFGAQNLIRDYFSGFMVLMEDQYGMNDVVKIGAISGMVEKITLRMTVLRDLEGVVHFIPHGTITTVSNLTHGWSRALFVIGVSYREDVDRVMAILLDLGKQIRKDLTYGPLILDDPEMLGVDGFGESSVVIKFFMKTRPLKQWMVKREMLRRIKRRFDEMGIEIPFPHRTVYHRYQGEPGVLPPRQRPSEMHDQAA
jgi:small conductance mechanosensitive channel